MNTFEQLQGTGVALVTPFTADGKDIDLPAIDKLVNHLIAGGIDYLVPLGTTAESATLSLEEKQQILTRVIAANTKQKPIVVGIGGNNTSEVVKNIKAFESEFKANVEKKEIVAVLSICPYYNKPNQQGIIKHYTTLADASALPIVLYNVPARTGVNMLAETTLKLADHGNIIGIKEASGNFEQCIAIAGKKPADFLLISGDDGLALPMMALGCHGLISVVGNAYPKTLSGMIKYCLKQDYVSARKDMHRLSNICHLAFAEGSPAGIKAFLQRLEIGTGALRLPLTNVSEELATKIQLAYQNMCEIEK